MVNEIKDGNMDEEFRMLKYLKKEELDLNEKNSTSEMRDLVNSANSSDVFVCALKINSPVIVEKIEKYENRENLNSIVNYLESKENENLV
jgi:hypothetical protein